MFRVKELKMSKMIFIADTVIMSIMAIIMLSVAAKIQERVPYFQSKEVKTVLTFCTVAGMISVTSAIVGLGMAIGICVLEKIGIVCPKCRRVYPKIMEICPKCNCELSHAKNVREALASGPLPDDKRIMPSVKHNFCTACGEKLGNDILFCPGCGTKIKN